MCSLLSNFQWNWPSAVLNLPRDYLTDYRKAVNSNERHPVSWLVLYLYKVCSARVLSWRCVSLKHDTTSNDAVTIDTAVEDAPLGHASVRGRKKIDVRMSAVGSNVVEKRGITRWKKRSRIMMKQDSK